MNKEDPVMKMYEAQAIAIEKQMIIEQLELEKQELMEKLKKYEEEKNGKLENPNILASIDKLSQQFVSLETRINTDVSNLNKKMDENFTKTWSAIDALEKQDIGELPKRELNTILLIGGMYRTSAILSEGRTKWIDIDLELPYETSDSGVVCLNGDLYICGGEEQPKSLYKLNKNQQWEQLASMNLERRAVTNSCLSWNGYIWVIGGADENGSRKSVERYDPKTNKWTFVARMFYPRAHAAAVVWNDRIIVSGGYDTSGASTSTVECYNLGRWMKLPDMPIDLTGHPLLSYKKKLVIIAGEEDGDGKVWEMNPHELNAKWKPLPPVKIRWYNIAGVVLDDEIYAISGVIDEDAGELVEIFDGKSWRRGPPHTDMCMSAVIIPQSLADYLCLTYGQK